MKFLTAVFVSSLIISKLTGSDDPAAINQGQKPIMKFGVIADAQYRDSEPAGTRFYRSSTLKLEQATASFKEDSVDFIINLGDLIDGDFNSFEKVIQIIESPGIPVYHVAGNHDFAVEPGLKNKIPVLQTKKGYYSVSKEGFRFIFLNGNEISIYASENKRKIKYAEDLINSMKEKSEINAIEWNGGISNKQLNWLNDQIDKAASENEKVIIICHFPLFPENVHNLLNYNEVLALLKKKDNIAACFHGHNHHGNYGVFNSIHFITFQGMVETENSNSYGIVELYQDRMVIKGYGREPGRTLTF